MFTWRFLDIFWLVYRWVPVTTFVLLQHRPAWPSTLQITHVCPSMYCVVGFSLLTDSVRLFVVGSRCDDSSECDDLCCRVIHHFRGTLKVCGEKDGPFMCIKKSKGANDVYYKKWRVQGYTSSAISVCWYSVCPADIYCRRHYHGNALSATDPSNYQNGVTRARKMLRAGMRVYISFLLG